MSVRPLLSLFADSPLHLAVENSQVELVRALLKRKANQYARNKEKKTPLQIARQVVQSGAHAGAGEARFSAALEMAALLDSAARNKEL